MSRTVKKIGAIRRQRAGGHVFEYKIVDCWAVDSRFGGLAWILRLKGTCAVCGAPFYVEAPSSLRNYLARTCPKHRRAGPKNYLSAKPDEKRIPDRSGGGR